MKKVLFILLILFIPSVVLADSVSPHIMGYEAIIINKKGAKVDEDSKKTIPYNTKIVVSNEYDGQVYACLKSDSDECFSISVKDIAPVKKEVVPKDLIKKDNNGTTLNKYEGKIYIYGKKGEKLKKGPSEAYGNYDTVIPYKEIVNYTYAIHFEGHGGGYTWFYIDEENYKGWVSAEDDIAFYSKTAIMTFKDIELYDIDTDKVIMTIPVETVFNEYYSSEKTYLTYKDTFGYIKNGYSNDDYFYEPFGTASKLGYILTTKSIEMKDATGKAITAIPKGERIKIIYGSYEDDEEYDAPYYTTSPICINKDVCLYYIEYNGVKGFVDYSDDIISLDHYEKVKTISYDEDKKLYDAMYYRDKYGKLYEEKVPLEDYSKEFETNDVIPAGTKVTYYMTDSLFDYSQEEKVEYGNLLYTIHLVKYNNKVGWIIDNIEDDRHFREENKDYDDIIIPEKEHFVMSKTMESIVNGIMIAIIASSIGFMLLSLVNKKPKEKNEG